MKFSTNQSCVFIRYSTNHWLGSLINIHLAKITVKVWHVSHRWHMWSNLTLRPLDRRRCTVETRQREWKITCTRDKNASTRYNKWVHTRMVVMATWSRCAWPQAGVGQEAAWGDGGGDPPSLRGPQLDGHSLVSPMAARRSPPAKLDPASLKFVSTHVYVWGGQSRQSGQVYVSYE